MASFSGGFFVSYSTVGDSMSSFEVSLVFVGADVAVFSGTGSKGAVTNIPADAICVLVLVGNCPDADVSILVVSWFARSKKKPPAISVRAPI